MKLAPAARQALGRLRTLHRELTHGERDADPRTAACIRDLERALADFDLIQDDAFHRAFGDDAPKDDYRAGASHALDWVCAETDNILDEDLRALTEDRTAPRPARRRRSRK